MAKLSNKTGLRELRNALKGYRECIAAFKEILENESMYQEDQERVEKTLGRAEKNVGKLDELIGHTGVDEFEKSLARLTCANINLELWSVNDVFASYGYTEPSPTA